MRVRSQGPAAIVACCLALGLLWAPAAGLAAEPKEAPRPAASRIVVAKPALKPITLPGAEEQGRLTGDTKGCPGCTVAVLDGDGDVVHSVSLKAATAFFELKWFDPGAYTVRVSVRGYPTLDLASVPLKAGHDTVLDIHTVGPPSPTRSAERAPTTPRPSTDPRRLPTWKPTPKPAPKAPARNFKPKSLKSMEKALSGSKNKGKRKGKGKKKKRK